MRKNTFIGNKAFSLLEMTVVIIILIILASAALPVLSRAYMEKAANKTALDISAIQEAARAYYVDNNKWPDTSVYPTAIAALQAGNYLPPSWDAINPFGASSKDPADYAYNTSSNGPTFTVSTSVPVSVQSLIQNSLPTTNVNGNNIFSTVPVPGSTSVVPAGTIVPWASNNLPSGFLWCNGQVVEISNYPGLFAVLGTMYGGDGLNTFGLPDLMGRTIVGIDGMGGATDVNRVTQWSTAPATMGGTFGEDVHALTIAEMPPHDFQTLADDSPHGGGWIDFQGNGDWHGFSGGGTGQGLVKYRTGFRGGNNDGSANSTVVPHNVVQPSMALGYIIKY